MFIKTIVKTDKKSGKRYEYYRLCQSYRVNGKPRHRTIISLGKLENLKTNAERKLLADRIEDLLTGTNKLFVTDEEAHIELYARKFYEKIVSQKLYDAKPINTENRVEYTADYQ